MNYFVTGGAGFVGSNMVDKLVENPINQITVYDNFSTGKWEFLSHLKDNKRVTIIKGDLLDTDHLSHSIKGHNFIFHFAANADVRFGLNHPRKDLEQNTIATFNVLEAMRKNNINKIVFSSTGSVYGEAKVIPTPEDAPFPVQTSLYGASKLACEGLIASYAEGYGFMAYIFRFVSIFGERYTHGHIYDFYKQLKEHPEKIIIQGNGKQKKSYLYVRDCTDAIMCAIQKSNDNINIFNLGTDEYCEVDNSVNWISEYMNVNPQRIYTGGDRGWIGDNPFIFLDCSKMKQLGWKAEYSIKDALIKTVEYIEQNQWIYNS